MKKNQKQKLCVSETKCYKCSMGQLTGVWKQSEAWSLESRSWKNNRHRKAATEETVILGFSGGMQGPLSRSFPWVLVRRAGPLDVSQRIALALDHRLKPSWHVEGVLAFRWLTSAFTWCWYVHTDGVSSCENVFKNYQAGGRTCILC